MHVVLSSAKLYLIAAMCAMVVSVSTYAQSFGSTSSYLITRPSQRSFNNNTTYGIYTSTGSLHTGSSARVNSYSAAGSYSPTTANSRRSPAHSYAGAGYAGSVSYGNGIVSTAKKGSIGYHGMSSNVTRPFRNAPAARPFVATGMPTGRVGLNTTPQVLADGGVALGQRHFAPGGGPGNIYQSFINWITSTDEYGGMNAWKDYDELNDNTDYLYYDMTKLKELWQQYFDNNDLPGYLTWEAFLDWFYSYQTDKSLNDTYRPWDAPVGNGVWILTAMASAYALRKALKKKKDRLRLSEVRPASPV